MEPNATSTIILVDHTLPSQPLSDEEEQQQQSLSPQTTTGDDISRHLSRRWTRPSVRSKMRERKYAKWQPHRLGLEDDGDPSRRQSQSSDGLHLSATETNGASVTEEEESSQTGFAAPARGDQDQDQDQRPQDSSTSPARKGKSEPKPVSELDVLYENQRGWFLFGIPLYSQSSLLHFDPSAWATHDRRDSAVNITNAQLPDPSWEWAWPSWYVDMSGDVDEQGWQYSWSFSSSAWHGNHPWFHSFVRRRRWVRLRVKRSEKGNNRREMSGFEMAHMLTEDYFTIHSSKNRTTGPGSVAPGSRISAAYFDLATKKKVNDVDVLEEIGNIPTLMLALRRATVDREKIDALRRFIEEGGDELYYLDERIPEIMSMFIFQASRWQFLTHLASIINELSKPASSADNGKEAVETQRRLENLNKAAAATRKYIAGPELSGGPDRASVVPMLDWTPASKRESLLSKRFSEFEEEPIQRGKPIKGIPKAAEIGRDGHLY